MFIRKNKIRIIILQPVDGATDGATRRVICPASMSLRDMHHNAECTSNLSIFTYDRLNMCKIYIAAFVCYSSFLILKTTLLNTILLSGPLLLNSFIDPDTFGKSCISFKPLNLDQKHVISK